MIERTLVVIKPDAIERGLEFEILQRFKRAGFKVVGLKQVHQTEEFFNKHYSGLESRIGEESKAKVVAFMASAPVIAAVLEGDKAVTRVRRMVGDTKPSEAAPGTLRGDYGHVSDDMFVFNLIHASSSLPEARREIRMWFATDEIHDHKLLLDGLIYTTPSET